MRSSSISTLVICTRSPMRAAGPLSLAISDHCFLVPGAFGVEFQRFARPRQQGFHRGVFGSQPADQFDPVFFSEFLGRRKNARQQDQDGNGCEVSHTAPSCGGSINGETCRRTGILRMYSNSSSRTPESQHAGLGPILAAAPQPAGGPRHLVARHSYSKPAHVDTKERAV